MKLVHLIFLLCGGLLVFAAYEHADEATASIGQNIGKGGFDRFQEKTKLSDQTLERGGEIFANMVEAVDKRGTQDVSAPAAAPDSAIHDELRGEIAALKSRVGVLERRKECTCQPIVAAPAAPVVTQVSPQAVYQDCSDGSCGTGRRRRGSFFFK